jgi:multiple sugar transport system substrate-binding protein
VKTTIHVAFRAFAAFEAALTAQVSAFAETNPDVEVALHDLAFEDLHERLVVGDELAGGDWDVFLCPSDFAPRLIAEGKLLCIDPELATQPPEGWPDGWSPTLLQLQRDAGGRLYGLPYHDGPEMLLYRTDLFEDPVERERFAAEHSRDLQVPESWDEFVDVARFFTRPERDLYGCVLAAKPDGHNNVYDFFIQLYSRGGRFADRGRAAFHEEEGVAGLEYLAALVADGLTQPDPRLDDSVASGEVYAAGHAAMMWNWCGFAAMAELPESRVRGLTGLAIIPRSDGPAGRHVSLSAYWLMTIPCGARDRDRSWRFLRFLAGPESDRLTALAGAIGCRRSTWGDREVQERFACYRHIEEAHRHAETVPNIPEYEEVNAVLNAAIDDVYLGRQTAAAALETAARRVDALLVAEAVR